MEAYKNPQVAVSQSSPQCDADILMWPLRSRYDIIQKAPALSLAPGTFNVNSLLQPEQAAAALVTAVWEGIIKITVYQLPLPSQGQKGTSSIQ